MTYVLLMGFLLALTELIQAHPTSSPEICTRTSEEHGDEASFLIRDLPPMRIFAAPSARSPVDAGTYD